MAPSSTWRAAGTSPTWGRKAPRWSWTWSSSSTACCWTWWRARCSRTSATRWWMPSSVAPRPCMAESIRVEVCYAKPEVQAMVALTVPVGTTALEAAQQSGLMGRYPEIDLDQQPLGIRGKRVELGRVLEEGDRVEILRPL